MKKSLIFLSGFFAFLIVTVLSSHHAYADVFGTDAVMNGLITQQQINQTQKPQFSDHNGSSEAIDPATGALTWKQNNIHLPGREGLDLDIGILYQSNYSFGYTRKYNVSGNIQKYNYLNSRYDLGIGWSFRFPSLQLQDGYMYYHNGEGSIYRVDFSATGTAESYTHLLGYQGKDLRFVQDPANTFSNGQANSAYYLEYASMKREYFASDGRLLGIVDRFGNKITFSHLDRLMYDGQTYKVIDSITDTVGRMVSFTYDTNLQTTTDPNFNGEKTVISVKDPGGSVVQSVTYTKWRSKSTFNGNPDGYKPFLSSIQNQAGDYLSFDYAVDSSTNMYYSGKFDYIKKYLDSYSGWNSNFLLNTVSYPNSKIKYQYEKVTRNLGTSGVGEEFRIISRKDVLKTDNNQINYTYNGDYTGYPTYYDQNNLPSTYTFSSTSTLQSTTSTNGLQTISTFNGLKQPKSTETKTSNGERKISTNLAFHSTFTYLPTSIQMADYAVGDTDITANKLFVNKAYNVWGGLQSETQPLTQTQLNDAATQSKYTTTYAYELTYNQLQSKSWYQNVSDTSASSESYFYDTNGRLKTYTNPKSEMTNTCYDIMDANGTITSSCTGAATPLLGKVQKVTSTKTLDNGKTAKTVTIFGSDTGYAYPSETESIFNTTNDSGQSVTQTVKKKMTYYIGTGLLKDVTDENTNKTAYIYDALGRTTEVKYPTFKNLNGGQYDVSDVFIYNNSTSSQLYDSTNLGISSLQVRSYRKYTQKSNNAITFLNEQYEFHDGLGNLRIKQFIDPNTGAWKFNQYHYDDLSRVNYSIDPMGNTSTANYDAWGRQNEVSDVYGNLYETEYNLKARRSTHYFVAAADVSAYRTNSGQNNLKSSYVERDADQWGRLLTTRAYKDWPNQTQPVTESYMYDILGNVTTYIDRKKNFNADGVTRKYTYDKLNRLVTLKDAMGQLTNYQYDTGGNLQQVSMQSSSSDTAAILNTKQYNEVGGLIQKTDPSNLSETYTYNNMGLLNKHTDRNGTIFTNQYDEQNRLTVSTVSASGTTLSSKSIIGSNGIMYDKAETYLNGTSTGNMTTGMDNMKRLTSISMSGTNYSSNLSLAYDSNSRVTRQTNNLSSYNVNFRYDKQRMDKVQVDGQSTANTADTVNASYEYYANGQVKTITYPTLSDGSVLKTVNTYDALNRLHTVTNTKGNTTLSIYSYEYDDNNNITSKTETVNQVTNTTNYSYDALNRLRRINRQDGSTASYMYDLKGNRSTLQDSAMNLSLPDTGYTYDLLNRLTSVTSGTITTSFAYAPNNLRYKKTSGTQTVQYQYNANGQVISESDGNNTVKANYIRGDRLLAKKETSTSKMYYYLYNGHGDVVQIVDANGTTVNQYQYDEWGNIVNKTEGISNSFKYAGEQYDDETGLYYLRARFYDPSVGRFINEDSYEGQINNPLSLNLYTYVENNPLIYSDPTGHVKNSDNADLIKLTKDQSDKWMTANNTECVSLSCKWNRVQDMMNAEKKADQIRSEYYYSKNQKLADDIKYKYVPVANHDLVSDNGQKTTVSVLSTGQVFYDENPKYSYWEQSNKTSSFEYWEAKTTKAVIGYGIGLLVAKQFGGKSLEHPTGFTAGILSEAWMPENPDVGERRTIIYRTDIETQNTQQLIVVTKGYNVIDYRYWSDYK
ncbi:hypothetical protein GCM10008018_13870 [Paenibacillus marchantiophytorum]|uniref:Teneurin-like YD-shell domain-containing protein n=1 Tax=Paenibacillus marchantiophytorum TaxID=1619310 RepID=A0ABQ2BTL9_9BACL|nr:RHS repeat-associated core domain-containing protein [Paenibacillus marchantiophytorum]GGI45787.1 hypothetical protein GCM10008018_13870 [Paenibacillus marchantiophytorum]